MEELREELRQRYRFQTMEEIEQDYSNWEIDPDLKKALIELSHQKHRVVSKRNKIPYFLTESGIMILDNFTVLNKRLQSLLVSAIAAAHNYKQNNLPSKEIKQMLEEESKRRFAQSANKYLISLEEICDNLQQGKVITIDINPEIILPIYINLLNQTNSLTLEDTNAYLERFNSLLGEVRESRTLKYESKDEDAKKLIKILTKSEWDIS